MMTRLIAGFSAIALLTACAGITAYDLKPDLKERASNLNGILYYMPKPYLLIMQGPMDNPIKANKPAEAPTGKDGKSDAEKKDQDKPAEESSAVPTDNSTTTFQVGRNQYLAKLIYLPDLSRPRLLQATSGMFGSVTFKPVLRDGWMLTSFDGEADQKIADILHSISEIITAKAAGKAGQAPKEEKKDDGEVSIKAVQNDFISPGLYELVYDTSGKDQGKLTQIKKVQSDVTAPKTGLNPENSPVTPPANK